MIAGLTVSSSASHPTGAVITFESRVTAPVSASSRPVMSAPVTAVIEALAMTVPTNCVALPSVAELPTCQNTLQALAPPVMVICELDPAISVLAAWNTQTDSAEPASVSSPLSDNSPPE